MRALPRSQSGYTLMEIVIVMAITAIMAAALVAFIGTATKNSRDGQRRDAVSKTQIALEQWAATHSGTYLSSGTVVQPSQLYAAGYLGGDVKVPGLGTVYSDGTPTGEPSGGQMTISDRTKGTGGYGYCVRVLLESGAIYGATDADKTGRTDPC